MTDKLPPNLTLAVDCWFRERTGLGGCSDKDVSELAEIFYEIQFDGGRESVDDALAIVEYFGPGVSGLNDTFARQVLLAAEVKKLREAVPKPLTDTEIWSMARKMADLFDYPWGSMPIDGRRRMFMNVKDMIAAAKETPHSTDSFTTHEVTQAAVRAGIKSAPFSRLLDELKAIGLKVEK